MAVRKIVSYGHPALRRPAQKVEIIDDEILQIIQDLKDTLSYIGGLGLAAPQIGVEKQIFLADLSTMSERKYASNKVVLINPEIFFFSKKTESDNEGCLSLKDVRGEVNRPYKIKIKGQLPSGAIRTIEATGLWARVLQHEYDHLHGKLIIDAFNEETLHKNKELIQSYLEENRQQLDSIME